MSALVHNPRKYKNVLLAFLTILTMQACSPSVIAQPATGTLLGSNITYPRLVRLAHGTQNGTVLASTVGAGANPAASIYASTDNGITWNLRSTVPVASGSALRCCGTLYELPQSVGSLPAGTLYYAASYLVGSTPAIEVYTSSNEGQTWSYSSTPYENGDGSHGLWEPQFTVADDGALVVFWSDETDPCCSQKLAQARTYNGTTWQNRSNTVASDIQVDRPGMAVVTKLPSGTYFMTYELCGPAACSVFFRTSVDGWDYGTASNIGTSIQTTAGQWFEHAPTNIWSPSVISSSGAILVVGQVLMQANGSVDPENGKVFFVNLTSDLSGPWYTIQSPVQIPNAYNNYCPNYSSAILPATDGSSILELASAYNSNNVCSSYFATESWNNLPVDGSTHVLQNVAAGLCLDDLGWGNTNGTPADLWNCTGSPIQNWTLHSQGAGYFSLQNQVTGLCVDNTGGSKSPGNKVTLWGCVNNLNQSWLFMDYGNGHYKLQNEASGVLNLDDPGGSNYPTTQLQIWTDNGLSPQHWIVR